TAVFQSSKRSPSLFLDGMRNRMMAKVIAMMASSIFGINFSKRAERKIQDNAAKLKMMKTAFSSKDGDPSFLFSSSITALPPGISFTFKGYAIFTRQNQATNMKTIATGTPRSIHFANDASTPYVFRTPAKTAFGGVPISVATPPMEAEYAMLNINALPKPKFSFDVSM